MVSSTGAPLRSPRRGPPRTRPAAPSGTYAQLRAPDRPPTQGRAGRGPLNLGVEVCERSVDPVALKRVERGAYRLHVLLRHRLLRRPLRGGQVLARPGGVVGANKLPV